MDSDKLELIDSIVDATAQEIMYEFDFKDHQAIKAIRDSLNRLEEDL